MTRPKFSIITPTYNRAYVLWKTIQSVQNQSLTDWELIIIDDGSADDTRKLVAEFQDDKRIKLFCQSNGGPSPARNFGLGKAQGEIIVYLDSDDELYPQYLRMVYEMLAVHKNKNYGICNHNRTQELIDEDFKTKVLKVDSTTQQQQIILQQFYNWETKTTGSGLFHRKDVFEGRVKWTTDIYIEDLEFLMQLAVLDKSGFLHIPLTLFHYRQKYGGDGLCSNATYNTWAHSFETIYNLHKDDPLMKNPEIYLNRVSKYKDLHQKALRGDVPPQNYKYFPELWDLLLNSDKVA